MVKLNIKINQIVDKFRPKFKGLFYIYIKYIYIYMQCTVAVFRFTRRRHQIPLHSCETPCGCWDPHPGSLQMHSALKPLSHLNYFCFNFLQFYSSYIWIRSPPPSIFPVTPLRFSTSLASPLLLREGEPLPVPPHPVASSPSWTSYILSY